MPFQCWAHRKFKTTFKTTHGEVNNRPNMNLCIDLRSVDRSLMVAQENPLVEVRPPVNIRAYVCV